MYLIVNHYKMADMAIYHGILVLLTGILLFSVRYYKVSAGIVRVLRLTHVTIAILTSIYGLLTYLITP